MRVTTSEFVLSVQKSLDSCKFKVSRFLSDFWGQGIRPITVNSSYFHPAHQHYTDEAHKAETVPSAVRNRSMAFRSY